MYCTTPSPAETHCCTIDLLLPSYACQTGIPPIWSRWHDIIASLSNSRLVMSESRAWVWTFTSLDSLINSSFFHFQSHFEIKVFLPYIIPITFFACCFVLTYAVLTGLPAYSFSRLQSGFIDFHRISINPPVSSECTATGWNATPALPAP